MCGVGSGYLAVWVLAMYLTTERPARIVYDRPLLIGLTGVLLAYWISHLWLVANRRKLTDDPIAFAIREPLSRAFVSLKRICAWLAVYASAEQRASADGCSRSGGHGLP